MNREQNSIVDKSFLRELLLTRADISRYINSLSKLARHLAEPVVLIGSIAAGWHLLNDGRKPRKRRLNDIDTVALHGSSSISPTLSRDFLVNHFHPYRGQGKVLLQLVDEEHRTRIEVFTAGSVSLAKRLNHSTVGGLPCRFVSAEDLLAKLLSIIHSVIEGEAVDPKYVEQFDSLSTVADMAAAKKLWGDYRKEGQLLDFDEAAELVKLKIEADPDLLQATRYCREVNFQCPWCHESDVFRMASRTKIYNILGYV
jgi:hypothetical protein